MSEGFAFPYGLCPACGGELRVEEATKAEGAAGREAIRRAFEIELGGMAFYAEAARQALDPLMKELFKKFEGMEKEHMATLSRRYHVEIPQSQEFKLERAAIYAGEKSEPEDPENLFRLAIAFERRAVAYFEERVKATPEGSPERKLYLELSAEEREHVDLLSTELARFRQGKRGLL